MVEGRPLLIEALASDLHKSSTEAYYTEMNLVEHEIQHMLDHLGAYMAPTAVGTDLLNIGGSSATYPDPLGVVLVIGAWNYPVQLTMLPVVGAIAAGNSVLIKLPSDRYSAATSTALQTLITKHMDPDCVQAVEGGREMTSAVLRQRFDKIFFTGGCFVGKMVAAAAAEHLTPTVLELGGKSPAIVTKSADIDIAPETDCKMKKFAYDFALHLQPQLAPLRDVFDALELEGKCKMTPPEPKPVTAPVFDTPPDALFVDYEKGSDSNAGTMAEPLKMVATAVGKLPAAGGTVALRAGTHFLDSTLDITGHDITIQN